MKSQFSIIFTTIILVLFLVGIILITSIYSGYDLYNYESNNDFSYSQNILYEIFSNNCLGSPSYPIFYTTINKLIYFNNSFYNELPDCAVFPYPFRVYINNYSLGIINYYGNCDNNSYFISIDGQLSSINIQICENYYSDFYYFVYNFCINNENISNQSFVFLSETYVYNNKICTESYNDKYICNIIPCKFINNISFYGSTDVYLEKTGNGIKIV
ncbi:hypothetical protein MJ1_0104 [Nanobdella aerobiophila]|uniref:Uncharacterized protein n=1 Tax=Nanobdella aerobiophila TaxID=2586965 RepID=A0A915WRI8_9ARCH|nr:hypothetical protein [Nanobdella aerobiophila]BBL45279.1 hypothetical protein MJ1_0104 [Nanobdella aerobiophila]